MPMLNGIVRYGYAPFMLIGLNGAAFWIVSQGHHYGWLALLLLTAFAVAHAAERIAPWFDAWNDPHHDDQTNAAHAIVYEVSNINGVLMIPLIVWMFPVDGIWPTEWPLIAQLFLAILIADFVFMFVHMMSHKYPLLWRLHAVHHGLDRLYGFNGLVRHPLHQTIDMVVATLPLVILGMPVEVAVLLGFAVSIQLIVQHSNVAAALGPFRNVMSIGQIHHLHHVNWGKEGDCNFGLFLTLWDRLFGTFHPQPPRPITSADMGIDEVPNFPKSYLEQLIFPFVYKPGEGEPDRYKSKPTAAAQARKEHDVPGSMQAAE